MAAYKRRSRLIRVGVALILLLSTAWVAGPWLVRRAIAQVAAEAAHSGHTVRFEAIQLDVWGRRIEVLGAEVAPSEGSDTTTFFRFSARSIALIDVDLVALVFRDVLHMRGISIHQPQVEHHVRVAERSAPVHDTLPPAGTGMPELIRVDTLRITDASAFSKVIGTVDTTLRMERLDLLVTALSIAHPSTGSTRVAIGGMLLRAVGGSAKVEPYYDLSMDSLRISIPSDSAVVFGLHLAPEVSPERYHREVDSQVELYALHADTILLAGFDVAAGLDHAAFLAEALFLSGVNASIHRDKSIPFTGTPPRKPLLAETIQQLPFPMAIDRVDVHRGRVTYHERLTRDGEYGSVTFGQVNGTLTGLSNRSPDGAVALRLQGHARLWDKAAVRLDMHMNKAEGPVRLELEVALHELPASELGRMTDDLVHVSASDGTIHTVTMHMHGDDVRARGTVEMNYEGLVLRVAPTQRHARLLSFAANRLVRSANMPGDKDYRKGSFVVMRKPDKSVFNYLWAGLREGMMEVMLHPVLLDRLKRHRAAQEHELHSEHTGPSCPDAPGYAGASEHPAIFTNPHFHPFGPRMIPCGHATLVGRSAGLHRCDGPAAYRRVACVPGWSA